MNSTYNDIRRDLSAAGLKPGDTVIVHSSLKSMGYVEGGPLTVIQALEDTVTEKGTLLFPALSFATVTFEHLVFSYSDTPVCVGLIPETFRHQDGVIRSFHPTHSVCAWGKYAREITEKHRLDNTCVGPNSPYRLLPEYGGKILMLGCGIAPMTFMHGVEEYTPAPYVAPELLDRMDCIMTDRDGTACSYTLFRHHFVGRYEQRYDRLLNVLTPEEQNVHTVSGAKVYLIDSRVLLKRASDKMRQSPYFFVDPV